MSHTIDMSKCPACPHPKHTGSHCSFDNCACTARDSAKADTGKPRFDLIPPQAMRQLAIVYEYGTRKYAANSWRAVEGGLQAYEAAGLRHYNAWKRGEKLDPESGLPHLAHFLWNVVAMIELDDG